MLLKENYTEPYEPIDREETREVEVNFTKENLHTIDLDEPDMEVFGVYFCECEKEKGESQVYLYFLHMPEEAFASIPLTAEEIRIGYDRSIFLNVVYCKHCHKWTI